MSASAPPDDERKLPAGEFDDSVATQVGKFDIGRFKKGKAEHPYFIVLAGEGLGRMYRIEEAQTIIGRAAEATLRLQDDGVSRKHAMVAKIGPELWIQDLQSANGTRINGELTERRMLKDGDQIQIGTTTILKFTYSDELEEQFQRNMYDAALRDGLTKAFNKRHFLDRLPTETAYARRHRTALCLLMIDVDHFKMVNDKYGHLAGDYVLQTLAQIVMSSLAPEDLFARYGGEEFAVLSRRVVPGNAEVLAERIRGHVQATMFEHQGRRFPVTISIGLAPFLDSQATSEAFVADADAALYESKRAGRNRVTVRK
jgi:diguanylate cyclase (GGDEF)-like protein